MRVKNLELGNKENVFFSTWDGDLVKFSLKHKKKWQPNFYEKALKAYRFESIIQMNNKFSCLCVLERENEKLVFIGGENDH